ncbi:MAG: hypothetical protein IPJ19_21485 [Planctomycetes bacterium]|nr:hypothetical protein [Planctomycetota bacterium]
MAILDSQGMAVIAKDQPEVVSKWLKRQGGMFLSVGEQACWVDQKDFPELEELRPFLETMSGRRLRPPASSQDGAAEAGVPRDLDERISRRAAEALKLLEAAADKSK